MLLILLACQSPSVVHAPLPPADDASAPLAPLQPQPNRSVGAGSPDGIYQIYVRSFQDSDGDGIGDLEGVRTRLDYFEALGVRTLWLMPLAPSFGPTGYDVTDYTQVTEAYGTEADLARLTSEAHERGLRVIVDLPLNHTHKSHAWFTESPELYVWADGQTGPDWYAGSEGWYYAYFGADMPDLDWKSEAVQTEMRDVVDFWMGSGADGFRLDAVMMLVEEDGIVEGTAGSHDVTAEVYGWVKANNPEGFVLAEANEWEASRTASWLGTAEAPQSDAVLDFPRQDALLALARGDTGGFDAVTLAEGDHAPFLASFITSHDTDRLADTVPSEDTRRTLRVVQGLLPGPVVLYYGDELDLPNSQQSAPDDAMRGPMVWDESEGGGFSTAVAWFPTEPASGVSVAAQSADPDSMLNLLIAVARVREQAGAYARLDTADGLLGFDRGDVRVFANFSDANQTITPHTDAVETLGTCGADLAPSAFCVSVRE